MSKLKKPTETWRVTKRNDEKSDEATGGGAMLATAMAGGDWRAQILPGGRQRVVDKIMQSLMRHLPFSGVEELQRLNKMADMLEERSFAAGMSLPDYLKRTASKLNILLETVSQNPVAYLQPKAASISQNPQMQVQIPHQVMSGEAVEIGDWRTQLLPNTRQSNVNTMMEALKKHIPHYEPEGLQERNQLAVKFEEEIYAAATSKLDYLRKISTKILVMETKSSRHFMLSLQPSSPSSSQNFQDPACALSWKNIWIMIPYQVMWGKAVEAMHMEGGDWRAHLQPDAKRGMVNEIVEILKGHPLFSGQGGKEELEKIILTIAEKIFAAIMQPEFVRNISTQIFAMEIKPQNPTANSLHSKAEQSNQHPQEPAYLLTLREIDTRAPNATAIEG